MVDRVSKEKRSEIMRAVKNKDTTPEMTVRRLIFSMGYRYRLHPRELPGRPDMVFPKYRLALFVHGCFWHRHEGCPKTSTPKTDVKTWKAKFKRNVERDQSNLTELKELGWRTAVIWECETKTEQVLKAKLRSIFRATRRK
jgi:DNA mismatch endonuclease (patch repair protein)